MKMTEFIATFPDIPRIITALAQWLSCMLCIFSLKRRIRGWKFIGVSVVFLFVQSVFMIVTDKFDGIIWNLCMAAAFLIMYGFIRLCADVRRTNAVCCCGTAFVASEFAASLEWQIWCYVHDIFGFDGVFWSAIILAVVFAPVFLIIWRLCRSIFYRDEEIVVSRKETVLIIVAVLLIFAVSNLGFLPLKVPFAGRDSLEIFNMRTLVDLGGLAMLFAYLSQTRSSYIQHELATIQTILDSQYEQYKQAQRTVDLINFRYHDLKNHIIALRADENASQRQEYLDKLEHEIKDYEALNKTGNQVLDTLLTSKNLRCMQHKIDMTCVIDGALFGFMDVMDICSIFGNAIDNAVECELKIQDYEKRMIHVDAFSEKRFLIIRFENYYEGNIDFEQGLPVTTKKGKKTHGYGLKSLRYTVRKYKGEVQIEAKDNWFSLRILIPLSVDQIHEKGKQNQVVS